MEAGTAHSIGRIKPKLEPKTLIIKAVIFAALTVFETAWLYTLTKAAIAVGNWTLS